MAQNLDLICVVASSTLCAGVKIRLEPKIMTFTPHFVCRYHICPIDTEEDLKDTSFKPRPYYPTDTSFKRLLKDAYKTMKVSLVTKGPGYYGAP